MCVCMHIFKALCRCSWHTMNYTFKVFSFVSFDACTHPWSHHHHQDELIYHPQTISQCPFAVQLSCPSLPPILTQQPICLLSLEMSLSFLEFYINEIIEHVLFCIWLLSLPIIIFRIICVLSCVSRSFLLSFSSVPVFHCLDLLEFVIPFTWGWTLGLFPVMMLIYLYLCLLWVSPNWNVNSMGAEACPVFPSVPPGPAQYRLSSDIQ